MSANVVKLCYNIEKVSGEIMITKWGFGMAPIKPFQMKKYKNAFIDINNFIERKYDLLRLDFPEQISIIKGLFNRILKQDQWDWFIIFAYFDFPPKSDISAIVTHLATLRKCIISQDIQMQDEVVELLKSAHLVNYINNFLTYDTNREGEYIYILSKKDEPTLLKIGRTSRNVIKRVNEINSATGVVYPYSARMVYKVRDSVEAEKIVHSELSMYRVREDREFFLIEFKKACEIIEECLNNSLI